MCGTSGSGIACNDVVGVRKSIWENTMVGHARPSYFPTSFLEDLGAKVC